MMVRWALVLFVSFFCVATGIAAEQITTVDTKQPIEITARRLELIQQQRQSIFTGDVVAKQGDMVLSADKLTVFLQEKQDQIDRLEAVGQVKVVQGNRVATADRAVFYQREEKLVLSGHAIVVQDNNKVSGDEIDIYLKENRSVIKSSKSSRVKAVIVPVRKQDQ